MPEGEPGDALAQLKDFLETLPDAVANRRKFLGMSAMNAYGLASESMTFEEIMRSRRLGDGIADL